MSCSVMDGRREEERVERGGGNVERGGERMRERRRRENKGDCAKRVDACLRCGAVRWVG